MNFFIGFICCLVVHFSADGWKNVWSGDTASFIVDDETLRLSAEPTQTDASIAMKSDDVIATTWHVRGKMDLNPSSTNYVAIYLAASSDDVADEMLSAYFLLLGKSNDEIALWKSVGGTQKKIAASEKKRLNFSKVQYDIVVKSDMDGNWTLMSKINEEEDYTVDFNANDKDIETSSYFILNPHFTKTRIKHYSFDSISINSDFVDNDPPYVAGMERNDSILILTWSEKIKVESVTSENGKFKFLDSDDRKTRFKMPVLDGGLETLSVSACDIRGNCSADTSLEIYFSEDAKKGDVILNEILFDTQSGDSEFVELYNKSDKWISAKSLAVANRKANGNLNYITPLSNDKNEAIPPHSYLLLSRSVENVCSRYDCADGAKSFILPKMPAFANSGGRVVLLDRKDNVLDEFAYDPQMHSQFSANDKGRSLERVSFDRDEWVSASDECGGATPGGKNSASSAKTDMIACTQDFIAHDFPEIVIEYSFTKPNFKGTLVCFDRYGKKICTVSEYQMLDREGEYRWNGTDEAGNQLSADIYVLLLETVAETGERIRKKIVCTIGER